MATLTDYGREDREYWNDKYSCECWDVDSDLEDEDEDMSEENGNDENIVLDEELDDETLAGDS